MLLSKTDQNPCVTAQLLLAATLGAGWAGQLLQAQHRRRVTPSAEVIWLGFVEGTRFWLRAATHLVVGVFVLGVPQTLCFGQFL